MAEVEEVPNKEEEVIVNDDTTDIGSLVTKDETSDDASKSARFPSPAPVKTDEEAADEGKESPVKSAKQSPPSKGESEIEEKDDKEVPKEEEEAIVNVQPMESSKEEIDDKSIESIEAKDEITEDSSRSMRSRSKSPLIPSPTKSAEEKRVSPMESDKQSPLSKGETEMEEKDDKEVPKEEEETIVKVQSMESSKEEIDDKSVESIEAKDEITEDSSRSMRSPSKSPLIDTSPKKSTEEKQVSPVKIAEQSPKKDETKMEEDIGDEEEDDEEEEEEEGEKKKGLFELPLVIEGERKRKSTSFFKAEEVLHPKHKAPVVAGSGVALEDIPFVAYQINAEKKSIDLRPLYHICYGTQGKLTTLKKELRKFNGFSFAINSEEYKKKQAVINKHKRTELAQVRRILGLASGKTKDDEVQIILDFLLKPHDEGKKVPEKRKSAGKTPKKGRGKKRAADDQSAKTPSKKTKKADSEDEGGEKDHDLSSESSEEQNELTPSDNEVKAKISELVKTFDLSTVSMNQMVGAVCQAFPEYPQLNERTASIKAFIKEAIKEVD